MIKGPTHQEDTIIISLNTTDLKNTQCKNCQLSFIWGKMRTAAWEIQPQTALRNCSREVRGKDSIHVILVKGEYVQSSTFFCRKFLLRNNCHHEGFQCFSRYDEIQELGSQKQLLRISDYLKICPAGFPAECLISALHPELLHGCRRRCCSNSMWRGMASTHGKCQFVVDNTKQRSFKLKKMINEIPRGNSTCIIMARHF